jgi:hypothetical protein
MRKFFRYALIFLAVVLVGLQFVPLKRDNPASDPAQDFITATQAPTEVATLLKTACYDCHSHKTVYPWYAKVAPASLLIVNHVQEGRHHLNFSTWTTYPAGKAAHKLEECAEEVGEGHMPIGNYTWLHPEAKLSDLQRKLLMEWFLAEYKKAEGGS